MKIWSFISQRPLMTAFPVAFALGAASGTHVEHLREASKRLELSQQVTACRTVEADTATRALGAVTTLVESANERAVTQRREQEVARADLEQYESEIEANANRCPPDDDAQRDRVREFGRDVGAYPVNTDSLPDQD